MKSLKEIVINALWSYRNHSPKIIGSFCQAGTHKVYNVTKPVNLTKQPVRRNGANKNYLTN